MQPRKSTSLLHRFFSGLAEYTFQTRLGIADPPLIQYLSDLLVRFVHQDSHHAIRNLTGRPLNRVADMLLEAQTRSGEASRRAHRHVGDFTLFWTGLYPEAIGRIRSRQSADHLIDYKEQGKRAYLVASSIEAHDDAATPAEVLQRLSHCFDLCAYGLREIRQQWENRDEEELPRPFLFD